MSNLLALLASLFGTLVLAAIASAVLFGDYREAFRIFYHLTGGFDPAAVPRDVPEESRRPLLVQLAFVAACFTVAVIGYLWLAPVFARALSAGH